MYNVYIYNMLAAAVASYIYLCCAVCMYVGHGAIDFARSMCPDAVVKEYHAGFNDAEYLVLLVTGADHADKGGDMAAFYAASELKKVCMRVLKAEEGQRVHGACACMHGGCMHVLGGLLMCMLALINLGPTHPPARPPARPPTLPPAHPPAHPPARPPSHPPTRPPARHMGPWGHAA